MVVSEYLSPGPRKFTSTYNGQSIHFIVYLLNKQQLIKNDETNL